MKFANTQLNYLFIVLAGLALLYMFAYKRRTSLLKKFAAEHLLPNITASFNAKKQNLKTALILAAVFLSIVALLRPQWGFHWEEVKHRGIDIFVGVDVSKSMLTPDVLPNRLSRAKLALEDLVKDLRGDRIGLIAFAGSAFVQCPLTIDYDGFLLAIEDLNPNLIPQAGTNIERAINEALKSFTTGSQGTERALIIITDGENHEGDPLRAAKKAQKENVKIYTIGVGTKEGELINIVDEQGKSTFLKDREGRVVKSRLNEKLLKEIAFKNGGTYIKSTTTRFGLNVVYNNKIAKLEKKELESRMEKRHEERFQIPLVFALILIFIEPFIANRRKQ